MDNAELTALQTVRDEYRKIKDKYLKKAAKERAKVNDRLYDILENVEVVDQRAALRHAICLNIFHHQQKGMRGKKRWQY